MIRDQRHMQGAKQHATVDDVRAFWLRFAEVEGFIDRATGLRVPGGALVDDDRELDVYVSDSRWVADCPECGGGVACWPGAHDHACCLDCGHVYRAPAPKHAALAVSVLLARPKPETRNWFPHRGETVADLKVENITRALPLAARV